MITLPTGLSLKEWADYVVADLVDFGQVAVLWDEEKWQDWAAQLFNLTGLGQLPQPYGFSDWREWAERTCQALN